MELITPWGHGLWKRWRWRFGSRKVEFWYSVCCVDSGENEQSLHSSENKAQQTYELISTLLIFTLFYLSSKTTVLRSYPVLLEHSHAHPCITCGFLCALIADNSCSSYFMPVKVKIFTTWFFSENALWLLALASNDHCNISPSAILLLFLFSFLSSMDPHLSQEKL